MKSSVGKIVTIGGGVLAGGLLLWYLLRRKKDEDMILSTNNPNGIIYSSNQLNPTPAGVPSKADLQDETKLRQVFDLITKTYGKPIAQNVERIYRWETGHFKSGQYLASGSAGMTTNKTSYPWGWSSLRPLWDKKPELKPVGTVKFIVEGKEYTYLAFPGAAGFIALAEILKLRDNNPGRWNSNEQSAIDRYNQALTGIRLRYTV